MKQSCVLQIQNITRRKYRDFGPHITHFVPTEEFLTSLRKVEAIEIAEERLEFQVILSSAEYAKFLGGMPSLRKEDPEKPEGPDGHCWINIETSTYPDDPDRRTEAYIGITDPELIKEIRRDPGLKSAGSYFGGPALLQPDPQAVRTPLREISPQDLEQLWIENCGVTIRGFPEQFVPTAEFLTSLRKVETLEIRLDHQEQILLTRREYDRLLEGMPGLREDDPENPMINTGYLWVHIRTPDSPSADSVVSISIGRDSLLMDEIRKDPGLHSGEPQE